jgi:hypothetical protein
LANTRAYFRYPLLNGVIFPRRPDTKDKKVHQSTPKQRQQTMSRLIKPLLFLLLIGVAAVVAFAYFGDISADQTENRVPVTLDGL